MEREKSKVLLQFLLIFRQSGDVLFFLHARRLREYTAAGDTCHQLRVKKYLSELQQVLFPKFP